MKNIINISTVEDMMALLNKKLNHRIKKTEHQMSAIQRKFKFMKGTNDFCNYSLQAILSLIVIITAICLPTGAIGSFCYSYNGFLAEIISGGVSTLLLVNALVLAGATFFLYSHFGEFWDLCTKDVGELFEQIFQKEKKIFDSLYKEKYNQLFNHKEIIIEQINDLEWFKDNYYLLLKKEQKNNPISRIKFSKANKMLKQEEDLVNVIFMLYHNCLKQLQKMDETEKNKVRRGIICKAKLVKEENDLLQQEVTKKIQRGESVRRIKRYYVDDTAIDNIDKKIKKLTFNK